MQGAREYASLFKTGQYGRLYIVSGEHARGKTFRIFVLPANEAAQQNGPGNAPLNPEAIEVYGVISGNPGWSEVYGWIHEGKWKNDFSRMIMARKSDLQKEAERIAENEAALRKGVEARISELLATY